MLWNKSVDGFPPSSQVSFSGLTDVSDEVCHTRLYTACLCWVLRQAIVSFGGSSTVDPNILVKVKEQVLRQIQAGEIAPHNLSQVLYETYQKIDRLELGEESQRESGTVLVRRPDVDWKKSITRYAGICLECGDSFKQLSRKHLALHDLDHKSYRLKFGIPSDQALVAKETTVRRRKVANWVKPWEQTTKAKRAKTR